MYYGIIKNNIEDVILIYDKNYILKVLFQNSENFPLKEELSVIYQREESFPLFLEGKEQITEYLSGQRTSFNLPIKIPEISTFESSVFKELIKVPFGEQVTYQQLAFSIGRSKAYRAVGTALSKNDLCLLIPCHRVVRAGGDVGGYRGGVQVKEKLLNLEKNFVRKNADLRGATS